MFEKIELGAFMFRESWSDLNLVLLKSTWCFSQQIFCCFDPLSNCLSKELIHTPFFFNYSSVYLSYLKKKKKKQTSCSSKPTLLPRPPPCAYILGFSMACGLDGCPAFSCLVAEMSYDDHTRLTSRDPAPLLSFTSFKFHLALLTGTLTPSAKIGIKQFWSEEKKKPAH